MEILLERPNKVIYRDGNYAVKQFDANYSTSDVLNEALNQARVEETGLPIPKLVEVRKKDDKWEIVMDYIPGKTMKQLLEEDPSREDEILDRFVDIQLSIHATAAPAALNKQVMKCMNVLKRKQNSEVQIKQLGELK